jgi:hypothetical protein
MAVKVLLAKCVGGCTYVVRHAGHGVRPARRERDGTEGGGGGVRMSSARNVATASCRVNRARGSLWLQAEKGLGVSMRCGRVGEVCSSPQSWVVKATDLERGGQREGAVGRVGDGYGTGGGRGGRAGSRGPRRGAGRGGYMLPPGWVVRGRQTPLTAVQAQFEEGMVPHQFSPARRDARATWSWGLRNGNAAMGRRGRWVLGGAAGAMRAVELAGSRCRGCGRRWRW